MDFRSRDLFVPLTLPPKHAAPSMVRKPPSPLLAPAQASSVSVAMDDSAVCVSLSADSTSMTSFACGSRVPHSVCKLDASRSPSLGTRESLVHVHIGQRTPSNPLIQMLGFLETLACGFLLGHRAMIAMRWLARRASDKFWAYKAPNYHTLVIPRINRHSKVFADFFHFF